MFSVLNCIAADHDLRLVILAALACAAACVGAFGCHARALRATDSTVQWLWIGLTGVVAGAGVWATHFIAMLAYEPSLPIAYEPAVTTVSLLMAVLGMTAGFAIPVAFVTRLGAIGGGVVTGLAIGAMHFTGIAAIRTQAHVEWDQAYVVASLVIGMAGASAAFLLRLQIPGHPGRLAGKACLLLAIVGLHFTAMTAVTLVPDPAAPLPAELLSREAMAGATVVLALLVLATAGALVGMERLGRQSTLSGLRRALDAVSSGLAFFDAEGRLLSWNRGYGAMAAEAGLALRRGLSREAMYAAIFAAGWRAQPDDAEDDDARALRLQAHDTDIRLPDGRWLHHDVFDSADGGRVSVVADITARQETARALAQARDSALAASQAKSQFLANISHEIRTPLNGVLGIAEALALTDLAPRQRDMLGVIRSSGELLDSLVGDLLDLARAEAGAVELRPEATDLSGLVHAARDLFAARAEQKGLLLNVEIAPDLGAALCDPLRMRQVLGNLVSNAVKFTEAGEVVISAQRDGDRVTFAVRDTGAGFDEAAKAVLFGRFQQADNSSTRRHGGAGLGLAICREYVAVMGGVLDCVSAPGAGSTFTLALDLPALADAAATDAGLDAERPERPFRVLVVDDNAINRQVLGLILGAAGLEHVEAEDGSEGVAAAVGGGFDVILMDIQMPVMDGLEAIRRIRAWETDERRARTPIYIVTANGSQADGATTDADGLLHKPVSPAQLLGALGPHLGAWAA